MMEDKIEMKNNLNRPGVSGAAKMWKIAPVCDVRPNCHIDGRRTWPRTGRAEHGRADSDGAGGYTVNVKSA